MQGRKYLARWCLTALATCAGIAATAPSAAAQFPAEMEGRVEDAATGGAVAGARVEVAEDARSVRSAADGSFLVRALTAGRRTLEVTAYGYLPARVQVEAADGRRISLTIRLHPAPVALSGVDVPGAAGDATARVIERETIEASGARDLGELLEGTPGVTVRRRGGPGAAAEISIRGSSANQVLVVVDGIPINSPLTGQADLSAVPLAAVARVSVLPGARTAEHGAGALAGVVVVETAGAAEAGAWAAADAGAWGEHGLSAGVAAVRSLGAWAAEASLSAEGRAAEGDFTYAVPEMRGGGEARRVNADLRRGQISLRGGLSRPGAVLRVRGAAGASARGVTGSILRPSPTARHDEWHLGGGAAAELDIGFLRVEPSIDLQRRSGHYHDPSTPYGGAYDETLDAAVTLARIVAAPRSDLPLRAGAEIRSTALRTTMLGPQAPARWDARALWTGGSAGGEWLPGWRAEARGMVRYDHLPATGDGFLSPRAVLTLARSRLRLHFAAGSAVSPPSPADIFFEPGAFTRPNPDLAPERVRLEVEAGAELRGGDAVGWTVRAEAYRADVEGMIIWSPDHRFIWSPRNFDVRRHGGMLAANVAAGAVALEAGWALAAAEYTGHALTGQVVYRPRQTASGGIRAALGAGSAEVSGRWVGERRTVAGAADGTLPPYWTADLRLSHPVRLGAAQGELWLALDDLFDRRAEAIVHHPSPGRAWRLGLRARWGADRAGGSR